MHRVGALPGRDWWTVLRICVGASSEVLKVMVMRSEATVLECARFIEMQLNIYFFCGKMWCSNY